MSNYLKAAIAWCQAALRYDLRSAIAQHSLIVLFGYLIRQALGLVSSAMLARSLGPSGLSVVAVVGAALNIGITIADFGLSNGAVSHIAGDLARQPDQARKTAASFVYLKLLGGALVAGGGALLAPWIAALLNLPPQSGRLLIWIACLSLVTSVLSGITGTILQALRRFRALVAIQSVNVGLTVLLVGLLFLTRQLTIAPAIFVGVVTSLVAAWQGLWLLPPEWRSSLLARGQQSKNSRLLRFSRWLWIAAIFSILSSQLDLLLLNRLTLPQTVGFYALALNLAFKVDIVNQTLHTVLLPTVSALTDVNGQITFIRRSLGRSLMLGLGLIVALPLARPFILLVYGQTYAPSVNIFYLLMAIVMFDLFTNPILLLAFPLNMPRLIAAADATRAITLVIVGSLLLPIWGIYGMVFAKLVAKVAGALMTALPIALRLRADLAATHTGTPPEANSAPDPVPPDAM